MWVRKGEEVVGTMCNNLLCPPKGHRGIRMGEKQQIAYIFTVKGSYPKFGGRFLPDTPLTLSALSRSASQKSSTVQGTNKAEIKAGGNRRSNLIQPSNVDF